MCFKAHTLTTRIYFCLPLIYLFLNFLFISLLTSLYMSICLSVYLSIYLPVFYHPYYLLLMSFILFLLLPFHAMPCIFHSFLLAFVLIKLCPICAERTGGSFKGGTDICSPLIRGSELVGDNIEWAGADLLMVTGNFIPSLFCIIPSLFCIITFFICFITPSSSIFSSSSRTS